MGDGTIEKMDVDYSDAVNTLLPECQQLASNGNLDTALEKLQAMEKQTRVSGDANSSGRVMVQAVKLCYECKNMEKLNDMIIVFTKKRSQLKAAVTKMVQEAYTYVDLTQDMPVKMKLIETLRTVTEGKIYVENERARLTLTLSKIKEENNEIEEAAKILQELQVETYGGMEREEKTEFILEQMRLCLLNKDYIRVQIISKKISARYFDSQEEDVQKLKIRFYKMMIELNSSEGSYLKCCKNFKQLFDTPIVNNDENQWKQVVKSCVLYALLAPHDPSQHDMLMLLSNEKKMQDLPKYNELLSTFTKHELIIWDQFTSVYEEVLRNGVRGNPATEVFVHNAEGEKRWADFSNRVVEHNIRIVAKYYTKITTERLGSLLNLPSDKAEDYLSKLVVDGTVYAKIDRIEGTIDFTEHEQPHVMLDSWSSNMDRLMGMVNKACHLISKEEMVHALKA